MMLPLPIWNRFYPKTPLTGVPEQTFYAACGGVVAWIQLTAIWMKKLQLQLLWEALHL